MIIVVDDKRNMRENYDTEVVYLRNASSAIAFFDLARHYKFPMSMVMLDHDLGPGLNGLDVARSIPDGLDIAVIIVVSLNPIGAQDIVDELAGRYHVQRWTQNMVARYMTR